MDGAVVRAERVEILDRDGRVRVVIGDLGPGAIGVSLVDEDGRRRASLSMIESVGTLLSFSPRGNEEALLGVLEGQSPADVTGGILMLADEDGVPVHLIRVADL